jgi:hypothetical protein
MPSSRPDRKPHNRKPACPKVLGHYAESCGTSLADGISRLARLYPIKLKESVPKGPDAHSPYRRLQGDILWPVQAFDDDPGRRADRRVYGVPDQERSRKPRSRRISMSPIPPMTTWSDHGTGCLRRSGQDGVCLAPSGITYLLP